jgi:hypothetical protein
MSIKVEISFSIYHWTGETDSYTTDSLGLHILDNRIMVRDDITGEYILIKKMDGHWQIQDGAKCKVRVLS